MNKPTDDKKPDDAKKPAAPPAVIERTVPLNARRRATLDRIRLGSESHVRCMLRLIDEARPADMDIGESVMERDEDAVQEREAERVDD